jgi:hypothetical protein
LANRNEVTSPRGAPTMEAKGDKGRVGRIRAVGQPRRRNVTAGRTHRGGKRREALLSCRWVAGRGSVYDLPSARAALTHPTTLLRSVSSVTPCFFIPRQWRWARRRDLRVGLPIC